jgi:hypothetical protein
MIVPMNYHHSFSPLLFVPIVSDRRKWNLALANESDTLGSIRIPYGLMVDNLTIPGFEVDNKSGLDFGLCKLTHGSSALQSSMNDNDFYLTVTVKVKRDSGKLARTWLISRSFLSLLSFLFSY